MQPPDHTTPAEPWVAPDEWALADALRRLRDADRPRATRCREVVVSLTEDDPGTVVHGP